MVEVSNYLSTFCVKCDTTCSSCFDDTMASCVSCPDDFTFNENTSYCIPPVQTQINTIESSYKWYGFSQASGWSGGSPTACGYHTVLQSGGGAITRTHELQPHYELRILVSLWQLSGSGTFTLNFETEDGTTFKTATYASSSFVSAGNNSRYCTGSSATNVDLTF